ncbi:MULTISPECIES: hypothetical protein [Mediterranea]|uniref:hypothetical protein n=1 Tax=Mediterranea TaxID=1926659 RepID=UPI002012DEEF|nr:MULTISPECIES: hypothetical protein [Mediterranea]MCL1607523.1 hypothetical protein [Mediterranea sp. ET5]MDM8122604.1 hypothetical protein [Mediterranea massiliensis]MDM8197346.1 hypothetical protein [Mediterranea massiliensis]
MRKKRVLRPFVRFEKIQQDEGTAHAFRPSACPCLHSLTGREHAPQRPCRAPFVRRPSKTADGRGVFQHCVDN